MIRTVATIANVAMAIVINVIYGIIMQLHMEADDETSSFFFTS